MTAVDVLQPVDLLTHLKDETRFNYYDLVRSVQRRCDTPAGGGADTSESSSVTPSPSPLPNSSTPPPGPPPAAAAPAPACPLANTLELFAFGNYPHYVKYQAHFIDLDDALLLKLIKLTILAMCSENEGSTISVKKMERDYGIESAIHHYYTKLAATASAAAATTAAAAALPETDCHLLESILFSMIDDSLINVKIDDVHQQIRIIKSYKLRDSYNSKDITLSVLKEEDIPRNAGTSYAKLEKWLQENIQPTRAEYAHQYKKFNDAHEKTEWDARARADARARKPV